MREDDRLPRFNRYSIPPRPGTVECNWCPAHVKPAGLADHMRAKHPGYPTERPKLTTFGQLVKAAGPNL